MNRSLRAALVAVVALPFVACIKLPAPPGPAGEDCTSEADCNSGLQCIEGTCRGGVGTACESAAACLPGQRCADGSCAAPDVDECLVSNGGCDANATCTNTDGGRTCACKPGYTGDGVTCADVDECLVSNGGCDVNATCANTDGARTCACEVGYSGDGVTCADIDECLVSNGGCDPNATCANTDGARTCACKAGYEGDGETCADVDECLASNGGCDANAACENTDGARTCACNTGYLGDGVVCEDIDECLVSNGGCDVNATCGNTDGARTCACNTGYSGDGVTCADVDECLTLNGGCDLDATCGNTDGARTCACNTGYSGDGETCADVDECLVSNGGCDANATCANTVGARTCACNTGYSGDGVTCADVDECLVSNGGCDANATCGNTIGARTCACNTGYSGNGVTCADIDECANLNGGCDAHANCANTPGARTCTCAEGYTGDGLACTPSGPMVSETCATALLLEGSVDFVSSTVGFVNDYTAAPSPCAGTNGLDRVYRVELPSGQRLIATVNGLDTFDPSISIGLAAACTNTGRICLAGDDSGGATTVNVVDYPNATGATQSLFIFVDSGAAGGAGSYRFTTNFAAIPSGDACGNAETPGASGTTAGTTLGYRNDYGLGTGCSGTAGPDRVYVVDLPPERRLTATVLGTGYNASISLGLVANACTLTGRTCLASADSATATVPDTVTYDNRSGATQALAVFVDSSSAGNFGPFTLTTAVADAPALPAGDLCSNAIPVTVSGSIDATMPANMRGDYGSGTNCVGASGLDVVYSIEVPPGKRLVASVAGLSTYDPSISLGLPSAACTSVGRVCLGGNDSGSATTVNSVTHSNRTDAAQTILAFIDSASSTASGTYRFTTQLDDLPPPLAGDTCFNAVAITPGVLSTESTTSYVDDVRTSTTTCRDSANNSIGAQPGGDKVYAINVPAGRTLTATVTGNAGSTGDVAIYLVPGPASNCSIVGSACLIANDRGSGTAAEAVSYLNAGATDQAVFIVVDSFSSTTALSSYSLTTTLSP